MRVVLWKGVGIGNLIDFGDIGNLSRFVLHIFDRAVVGTTVGSDALIRNKGKIGRKGHAAEGDIFTAIPYGGIARIQRSGDCGRGPEQEIGQTGKIAWRKEIDPNGPYRSL